MYTCRILVVGVGPSHVEDCKAACMKLCKAVLGNADFQLGKTKVFLKVSPPHFHSKLKKKNRKNNNKYFAL